MKRIEIRLNEDNNDLLEAVAAADNVPVSAWIIQQALSAARRHPTGRGRLKAAEAKVKADAKIIAAYAKQVEHFKEILPKVRANVSHDPRLWQAHVEQWDKLHKDNEGFADWVRDNQLGPT